MNQLNRVEIARDTLNILEAGFYINNKKNKAPEYYAYHRNKTLLYSDHMIYSPKVPVFKDEEGNLLDEVVCTSIITSPAANAGAVANSERSSLDKILPVMRTRIDKLLALCRHYNHEALV